MDIEMVSVAERLVGEFVDLPGMVVIEAVCDCVDECGTASSFFVEQAARARLAATAGRLPRQRTATGRNG